MVRYVLDDGSRNMKSPWTVDISTTNATALTINTNHVSAFPVKLKNAASSASTSTALNFFSNDDKNVQIGINSSGHSDSRTGYLWHFDNYDLKFGTNNSERLRIKNNGDVQVIVSGTPAIRFSNDSNGGIEIGPDNSSSALPYVDFHFGRSAVDDYNIRIQNDGDKILSFSTRDTGNVFRINDTNVQFGSHTAIGAETVTGYITILDSGGTSRKIAVVS